MFLIIYYRTLQSNGNDIFLIFFSFKYVATPQSIPKGIIIIYVYTNNILIFI